LSWKRVVQERGNESIKGNERRDGKEFIEAREAGKNDSTGYKRNVHKGL